MRTLIWIATWAIVALWSGLCWLAHGLVGIGGSLVAGNADLIPVDPQLIEWASWLATAGTGLGEWLVIAIWALVTAVVFALAFAATRLLPRLKPNLQTS